MLQSEAIAMVIHNHGDLITILKPSCRSRMLPGFCARRAAGCTNLSIGKRQAAETRNDNALMANAVEVLPNFTMTPLSAGPITFATSLLKLLTELALTRLPTGAKRSEVKRYRPPARQTNESLYRRDPRSADRALPYRAWTRSGEGRSKDSSLLRH